MGIKVTAKACIIGDPHSGKSTFANCGPVVRESFIYGESLGLNIYYHGPFVVQAGDAVNVNLLLWELTVDQQAARLRKSYLRGASVVFILYDMGTPNPFKTMLSDIEEVRQVSPTAHIYLVANKIDLEPSYDFSGVEQRVYEQNATFAKVTASQNVGVEALFQDAALRVASKAHRGQLSP